MEYPVARPRRMLALYHSHITRFDFSLSLVHVHVRSRARALRSATCHPSLWPLPRSLPPPSQMSHEGQEIVLATLDNKICYQHNLDLVVEGDLTLINTGPSPLHVSGYQTVAYPPVCVCV